VGDLELPKIDAAQMGMPSAPSYGLHQQPHIQTNVAAQTGCLHVENTHNTDTTEAPNIKHRTRTTHALQKAPPSGLSAGLACIGTRSRSS